MSHNDTDHEDTLGKSIGITPLRPAKTITVPKKNAVKTTSDEQFDIVKRNIQSVNEVGEIAMNQIADLADQSQQPRAYEVLSTIMAQLVNANKTLIDIEKIKIDIEEKQNKPDENKTVNNTLVFHGSTAEIMEQIKASKE